MLSFFPRMRRTKLMSLKGRMPACTAPPCIYTSETVLGSAEILVCIFTTNPQVTSINLY